MTLSASRILFWQDRKPNEAIGAAPPTHWRLEYCHGRNWLPVQVVSRYDSDTERFVNVRFKPVRTRCLRASFISASNAGVAVREWEALAVRSVKIAGEGR